MSDSFVTPWTVACQPPLSVGFPRQDYWSGLLFPSPGDLQDSGIEQVSPALAGRFFTVEPPGKPFLSVLCFSRTFLTTSPPNSLNPCSFELFLLFLAFSLFSGFLLSI